MKRLRDLRESRGFTQAELARMLKTSAQAVARWESGKADPDLVALRDLALVYGTSVDDLLHRNPLSSEVVTHHSRAWAGEGESFWGHLGVQLPGDTHSRWYPVTLTQAATVGEVMAYRMPQDLWLIVPTLNNRLLVLNPRAVKRVSLLDDDADELDGDWSLGWDASQGHPLEIYRALADWFVMPPEDMSEAFRATVEDVLREEGLDAHSVEERVCQTVVHYTDGTVQHLRAGAPALWATVMACRGGGDDVVFDLSNRDQALDVYVPATAVRMLDVPLYQVIDGARAQQEEEHERQAAAQMRKLVSKVKAAVKVPPVRRRRAPKPPAD